MLNRTREGTLCAWSTEGEAAATAATAALPLLLPSTSRLLPRNNSEWCSSCCQVGCSSVRGRSALAWCQLQACCCAAAAGAAAAGACSGASCSRPPRRADGSAPPWRACAATAAAPACRGLRRSMARARASAAPASPTCSSSCNSLSGMVGCWGSSSRPRSKALRAAAQYPASAACRRAQGRQQQQGREPEHAIMCRVSAPEQNATPAASCLGSRQQQPPAGSVPTSGRTGLSPGSSPACPACSTARHRRPPPAALAGGEWQTRKRCSKHTAVARGRCQAPCPQVASVVKCHSCAAAGRCPAHATAHAPFPKHPPPPAWPGSRRPAPRARRPPPAAPAARRGSSATGT